MTVAATGGRWTRCPEKCRGGAQRLLRNLSTPAAIAGENSSRRWLARALAAIFDAMID